MQPAWNEEWLESSARLRLQQESEVAVSHVLTEAEFALAREASSVGRTFTRAGLTFDLHTFVALRLFESTLEERLDPVDALGSTVLRAMIERTVALAGDMLAA